MVSIKVYSCYSMIVGNFVDVYPLGIIAVLMNRFIYRYAFGMLIPPFPFYPFPLRYSLSLPIPRLPDPFPSFPQPLTLRNRLPINIPAGSLLSTPLAVALKYFSTNRMNDPRIESMIPLTYSEQTALIPGTK